MKRFIPIIWAIPLTCLGFSAGCTSSESSSTTPPLANAFRATDLQYTVKPAYGGYDFNGKAYAEYTNNSSREIVVNGAIVFGDGKTGSFTGLSIPSGPGRTGQWESWNIWHLYTNTGTYTVDITLQAQFPDKVYTSTLRREVTISQ